MARARKCRDLRTQPILPIGIRVVKCGSTRCTRWRYFEQNAGAAIVGHSPWIYGVIKYIGDFDSDGHGLCGTAQPNERPAPFDDSYPAVWRLNDKAASLCLVVPIISIWCLLVYWELMMAYF